MISLDKLCSVLSALEHKTDNLLHNIVDNSELLQSLNEINHDITDSDRALDSITASLQESTRFASGLDSLALRSEYFEAQLNVLEYQHLMGRNRLFGLGQEASGLDWSQTESSLEELFLEFQTLTKSMKAADRPSDAIDKPGTGFTPRSFHTPKRQSDSSKEGHLVADQLSLSEVNSFTYTATPPMLPREETIRLKPITCKSRRITKHKSRFTLKRSFSNLHVASDSQNYPMPRTVFDPSLDLSVSAEKSDLNAPRKLSTDPFRPFDGMERDQLFSKSSRHNSPDPEYAGSDLSSMDKAARNLSILEHKANTPVSDYTESAPTLSALPDSFHSASDKLNLKKHTSLPHFNRISHAKPTSKLHMALVEAGQEPVDDHEALKHYVSHDTLLRKDHGYVLNMKSAATTSTNDDYFTYNPRKSVAADLAPSPISMASRVFEPKNYHRRHSITTSTASHHVSTPATTYSMYEDTPRSRTGKPSLLPLVGYSENEEVFGENVVDSPGYYHYGPYNIDDYDFSASESEFEGSGEDHSNEEVPRPVSRASRTSVLTVDDYQRLQKTMLGAIRLPPQSQKLQMIAKPTKNDIERQTMGWLGRFSQKTGLVQASNLGVSVATSGLHTNVISSNGVVVYLNENRKSPPDNICINTKNITEETELPLLLVEHRLTKYLTKPEQACQKDSQEKLSRIAQKRVLSFWADSGNLLTHYRLPAFSEPSRVLPTTPVRKAALDISQVLVRSESQPRRVSVDANSPPLPLQQSKQWSLLFAKLKAAKHHSYETIQRLGDDLSRPIVETGVPLPQNDPAAPSRLSMIAIKQKKWRAEDDAIKGSYSKVIIGGGKKKFIFNGKAEDIEWCEEDDHPMMSRISQQALDEISQQALDEALASEGFLFQ
ncbi:hypothetical protein BABINDRAFT_13181 [Babjeviella inositovora NRRL Y-12698]|uniref:Uncharacterized protein n=1 Tax=Babjeviella inositovora NRRL Y-12698 TaxID=984486 RepID=A0A1E3QRL4_9ASCO|nr:uncharacterized protein BABINDRAFT_13181 [Babjeviella inositovora NRRL Y-12698]ODQ80321.1 hypothetical protein BABINDRAFT_13181 [Babjeviella inositovora NRRL Y-12698]